MIRRPPLPVTRRQALLGCLCAGADALASAEAAEHRATPGQTAATTVPPFTEVAPGIFVRRGLDEDATASNDDAIANIGFVIGKDAVAVIDPGGSLQDGQRLRAYIA